jgi:POT family proton-dependent oligopeptide transporter
MSALYLLGISLGSLFDTIVNASIANHGFFYREGASFYWFFIEILAAFIVIYLLVAKRIPEKSYLVERPQSS